MQLAKEEPSSPAAFLREHILQPQAIANASTSIVWGLGPWGQLLLQAQVHPNQ
jgi:hypothetical protein